MFFTGCDEEEETVVGSTDEESYTIDDMMGTWDMTSHQVEGSVSIDFSSLASMYSELDQAYCEYFGLVYDEVDGCTMDDTMLAMMVAGACVEMGGTLAGTTCTMDILEQQCCEEGESEVATITSDGVMTVVGVDEDDQWTMMGTISIDGTAFTIELDEECECFELDQTACGTYDTCEWSDYDEECSGDYEGDCSDTLSGTLSIDGNTATMTMEIDFEEFLEDFMDEDEEGEDFDEDCGYAMTEYECDSCGGDWDPYDDYCYDYDEDEDDGPPECIEDCIGFDEEFTEAESCEWIIAFDLTEDCFSDCDQETLEEGQEHIDYCTECLANDDCDEYEDGEEGLDFDLPVPTGSVSQVIVWEKAAE